MKPGEYLHLQMELEGIKTSSGNLIARVSPEIVEFPLVLFAITADEQKYLYFDGSLPTALQNKLSMENLQPFNLERAVEILRLSDIHAKLGCSRTYLFPDRLASVDARNVKCFSQDDPEIVAFGFSGLANKVYAIEREGTIVSACVSSRQNSKSAEAWVFTHPDHRRKGHARQVVTAWADSLKQECIIPFYSHNAENTRSANLASKMGLIHIYDEFVIEKVA